jgi:hypothetical protein
LLPAAIRRTVREYLSPYCRQVHLPALILLKTSQAESNYPVAQRWGLFCCAGRESKDGGQGRASKLIPQQYHALSKVAENSSDRG